MQHNPFPPLQEMVCGPLFFFFDFRGGYMRGVHLVTNVNAWCGVGVNAEH